MRMPRPNGLRARETCSEGYGHAEEPVVQCSYDRHSSKQLLYLSRLFLFGWSAFLFRSLFGPESQILGEEADESADHRQISKPLQGAFPQLDSEGDLRILRKPTVKLRLGDVVQDVDHPGAADSGRVIDSGVGEIEVLAELLGAALGQPFHVVLAA